MQNLLNWFTEKWSGFSDEFYRNFIQADRWKFLLDGLKVTLEITFFAVILGILLGFIIAIVRASYDKADKRKKGFFSSVFKFGNFLCKLYLTVIRGTPIVVQLMIIYFVVLASVTDKVMVAVIAFGINSGAYVAEIVRSGIMSIDKGQFEAGRSLGLNYVQTMVYIIMPQAFKNILPALGNEFIVLLKETSISGYIALNDLARGGYIIRSRTYSNFMPLLAVALIYLVIVLGLSSLLGKLERRLRNSDR